jgi:transketolase
MWKLDRSQGNKEMRVALTETLQELMKENSKIVALDADLAGCSGFNKIQKSNPDQFVQCGIAEANMVGVAAGMSMRGYVPFIHSFAPFATRRVLDQIYMAGAYSHNTINIFGSDPGVCAALNGGTHTTLEDIADLRAIPEVLVAAPADEVQMAWMVRQLAGMQGVHYIRSYRKVSPRMYAEGSTFTFGKGNVIRQGSDVLLVSMGDMLSTTYDAAEKLAEEGIQAEVIDMFTLKPFDTELLQKEAAGKKLVVTVEDHSVMGGLGSIAADALAEAGIGVRLRKIGSQDRFGQVGPYDYLKKEYGMTVENITETVKNNI